MLHSSIQVVMHNAAYNVEYIR